MLTRKNRRRFILPAAGALIAISASIAPCQCMFSPSAVVPIRAASSEQMPAYEVATIKPWDGNGFATPLRFYIGQAFGIPPNITARIAGPDWISNTRFVIQSKPSDAIRDAMQQMAPAERSRENGLMMQSLLADRFAFKAHFETRELRVYELVLAKGGPKLVKNSDPTKARFGVGSSMFRAAAVSIQVLIGVLECNSDIGGREVVDKTGLTGTYDISLKWAPLQTAPAAGESAGAPSSDEGPSLFTAIEEQLRPEVGPCESAQRGLGHRSHRAPDAQLMQHRLACCATQYRNLVWYGLSTCFHANRPAKPCGTRSLDAYSFSGRTQRFLSRPR